MTSQAETEGGGGGDGMGLYLLPYRFSFLSCSCLASFSLPPPPTIVSYIFPWPQRPVHQMTLRVPYYEDFSAIACQKRALCCSAKADMYLGLRASILATDVPRCLAKKSLSTDVSSVSSFPYRRLSWHTGRACVLNSSRSLVAEVVQS
jgi:hypothetical protein